MKPSVKNLFLFFCFSLFSFTCSAVNNERDINTIENEKSAQAPLPFIQIKITLEKGGFRDLIITNQASNKSDDIVFTSILTSNDNKPTIKMNKYTAINTSDIHQNFKKMILVAVKAPLV